MALFKEVDQMLAMIDLDPRLSSQAIRVTTQMNIESVPIVDQVQWVKSALLASENGEYWKHVFANAERDQKKKTTTTTAAAP
jgi:hypothetical protein